MAERKYESPGQFFKSFFITYFLVGIVVYFTDSIFKISSSIYNIIPTNNYYISFAITQVIVCLVSVIIIWFSLKHTYKDFALKASDANKVFNYFVIMMIIFFVLSVSMAFLPGGTFGMQFTASILKISEGILIAMNVLGSVFVYGISVFFFRKFLFQGAEE